MPAADEFPRGVTLQSINGSGSAASVAFPSFAGSWVITDVSGKIANEAGSFIAQVWDNYSRNYLLFATVAGTGTSPVLDSQSWTGKVIYPYGVGPTFAYNVALAAGSYEQLWVAGYPI